MTDFRSQHHGIQGLVKDHREPTVDINEKDAAERGIKSGDIVEVRTRRGSVPFRAHVTDDIVRGAIECNMGGGTPVGTEAWQQWNVNELTDLTNFDKISGFPVYKALLCDVVKVESTISNNEYHIGNSESDDLDETLGETFEAEPVKLVYLDNNATTQVADEVREAMLPFLNQEYGNPSSIHGIGRDARTSIENARRQVARLLNAQPRRLIFTGGGSEADNLAIKGVALSSREKGNHIITTTVEHPAILNTCAFLEKEGFEITYLPVDNDGWLAPTHLKKAIKDSTILVSIIMANNEVGTILPIKELAAITHKKGAIFHTDAVQAVGKIKLDIQELDVDMLSVSAHKFHGPKGIGALYVKRGINLEPLIHGGAQENRIRAGTENVPSIVGLGIAAELAMYTVQETSRIEYLRDKLADGIAQLIPLAKQNGHSSYRLPNTLNLTLPGLRGESIVISLDHYGIAISSGSACQSGLPEPTHVLLAMGRTNEEAHCSVRFSLSRYTTEYDIERTITSLEQVLKEKEIVRLMPCK